MATREDILDAVADEGWQEFRLALKGKSTEAKLRHLSGYYDEGYYHYMRGGNCGYENCELFVDAMEWEYYKIRIDNYIKALCRGGQLYPGESLETALQKDWKLRIKR